ncbi:hypothetical protein [Bdellovibrio svalbardensis]|uniref:Glycosyltransferase RgtA/B/C/D-like domain-containing protein n=1 Tax=Bdellovibrio svalbardensis TaxID=2972972 RepID=A0ABT6DKE1_9BACT|nr:hypothetical protein [Bdellovibrio svalbardensis]MDG0817342.1 hypothetical protein [Bdellovibrio svalbardensis]
MFIWITLKYFFAISSICLFPVRALSFARKRENPLLYDFCAGLFLFFCALIFLPNIVLLSLMGPSCIAYIFFLKRRGALLRELKVFSSSLILSAILLTIYFLRVGHFYDLTEQPMGLNQDIPWHIALAIPFKLNGPYQFKDPRIFDYSFSYHFFIHNLWAKFTSLFKDNLFENVLGGIRPALTILNSWLLLDFFTRELKSFSRALISSFGVFFCFSYFFPFLTFNDPVLNVFPIHLLDHVNGIELVTGVFLAGLIAIYKIETSDDRNLAAYFTYFICVCLCLGIKAPFAVVLLGTVFLSFVWKIFSKQKINKIELITWVTSSIVFVTTYLIYFAKISASTMSIAFAEVLTQTPLFLNFATEYSNIVKALLVIPFIILFFGPTLLPFIFNHRICKAKPYSNNASVELGTLTVISGCFIFMIIHQRGLSELYFAFGAILGCNLFAWINLFTYQSSSRILQKFYRPFMLTFLIFSIVAALWSSARDFKNRYSQQDSFQSACRWIKNNTPTTALIAINKQKLNNTSPRFFYCSPIAERQFFLEGYDFSDTSLKTSLKIANLNKVNYDFFSTGKWSFIASPKPNYLVYFKDGYGNLRNILENYVITFESRDAIVLKLKVDL